MINYQEVEVKQALYRQQVLDPWLPVRYAINPYSGCEYECGYCPTNWKTPKTVITKKNILIKLEQELKHLPEQQLIGVGGGYNDIFAPINEQKKLSEEIIVRLMESGHKPLVMTKNLGYVDVFKKKWLTFPPSLRPILVTSLTLGFKDHNASFIDSASRVEQYVSEGKNVPSVKERLDILRELEKDFVSGVLVLPIVAKRQTDADGKPALLPEQFQKLLDKIIIPNISNNPHQSNQNSSAKNIFVLWGEFRCPQNKTSLLQISQPLPNHQDKKIKKNYQIISEYFHNWSVKHNLSRWLRFDDCKDYLSPKDVITVLLLRYYYIQKYAGFEKQAFRLAAYQLNRITEKEFIQIFSAQKLETLSGIGEVIANVITRYIKSKNLDFFSNIAL